MAGKDVLGWPWWKEGVTSTCGNVADEGKRQLLQLRGGRVWQGACGLRNYDLEAQWANMDIPAGVSWETGTNELPRSGEGSTVDTQSQA